MIRPPSPIRIAYGTPGLVLAPMEGVTDFPMRAFVSEQGGILFCVSEFLRITDQPLPLKVFLRHVPELLTGGKTASGIGVQVQLLGGNAERLAEAAALAVSAGALGIDLNFGCPAPTVNRHDGGATLLKYPGRIRGIVEAVRKAVPAHLPVTAKLRLGWDDIKQIHENADRAAEGGADWITIHARTRMQGYAPPVYWEPIGEVRRRLTIPVVANGDVNTTEALARCRDVTGCEHFMIGRGALANPRLMRNAEAVLKGQPLEGASRPPWEAWLQRFEDIAAPYFDNSQYRVRRMKQWLKMASVQGKVNWFDRIKQLDSPSGIVEVARNLNLDTEGSERPEKGD